MDERKKFNEINDVNNILSLVINQIDIGKGKMLKIGDSLKAQYIKEKVELENINNQIDAVIEKVDRLEKMDKLMRKKLARSFKILDGDEARMKSVYKEALDIRVEYISMQKEEQKLQYRRDKLQRYIKDYESNIMEVDNITEQVNVALKYLSGDLSKKIEDFEGENKFLVGIKMVQVEEKVRNKIAREIHDGPAQYLANIVMMIDFCKNILAKDLNQGLVELTGIQNNVKKTLKEVRGIIFDLRPPFIEGITLREAFEDLQESFKEESNIELKSEFKNISNDLDITLKTNIYRIVQELFSNIRKHSKATKAHLKVEGGMNCIYIYIKDNGIGFNYEDEILKSSKKFGLQGMKDRIEEINGEIKVNSVLNKGTEYKIKLPKSGRDEF